MSLRSTVCILASFIAYVPLHAANFRGAVIQTGAEADSIERNVAALLAERIAEPSGIPARVVSEGGGAPATGELAILLGIPDHHHAIAAEFDQQRIPRLTGLAPGPEGFLLRTVPRGKSFVLIAAGIDDRGALYAAGEILRRMTIRQSSFEFPDKLTVRTAPAFEVRGTQFNQSGVARTKGKVRLATGLAVPERMSDFFTFDIPPAAIRNGELVIRFQRAADVAHGSRVERETWRNSGGWGTIVSEAWLMKRR